MALIYGDETRKIIGHLMDVHNQIGPGLDEFVYQDACEERFRSASISFRSQCSNWLLHRNQKVKELIPDFLIEGKFILELKAIFPEVPRISYAQIINYCKLFDVDLGLIANFGLQSLNWKRVPFTPRTGPTEILEKEVLRNLGAPQSALFSQVIQAICEIFEIHTLGYTEDIYSAILMVELERIGLRIHKHPMVKPQYPGSRGKQVQVPVILIENICAVYVSSLYRTVPAALLARMRTYLKFLSIPIGLIVNFGTDRLQIKCVTSRF